jgi:hypothetical protein
MKERREEEDRRRGGKKKRGGGEEGRRGGKQCITGHGPFAVFADQKSLAFEN